MLYYIITLRLRDLTKNKSSDSRPTGNQIESKSSNESKPAASDCSLGGGVYSRGIYISFYPSRTYLIMSLYSTLMAAAASVPTQYHLYTGSLKVTAAADLICFRRAKRDGDDTVRVVL